MEGKCTAVLDDMAEKLPCSYENPEADDTADFDKQADDSSETAQGDPVSETFEATRDNPGSETPCISQIPAAPRLCLSCMTENDSDSVFCRNCGTRIPLPENPTGSEASAEESASPCSPCRQKSLTTPENITPSALKTDKHQKMLHYGGIVIIVLAVILATVSLKKEPEITPSNPVYNGSSQTYLTPPPDIDQNSIKSEELIRVLHDNYDSVNNKDFDRVYNLRSERLRRKNSPEYYMEVYQENLSVEINEAHVQELGSTQAKVAVNLTSFDIFNGVKIRSVHTGWFLLVKEQNRWLIDDSGLKLIDQSQVNQ